MEVIDFLPRVTSETKNVTHARVPMIPVAETWVGMNPMPKGNAMPQNGVALTPMGLCASQSWLQLLGPDPSNGPPESAALETPSVAEKDGLTSALDTPDILDTASARVSPEPVMVGLIRNARETAPRTIGRKTGFEKKPCPPFPDEFCWLRFIKCFSMVEKYA